MNLTGVDAAAAGAALEKADLRAVSSPAHGEGGGGGKVSVDEKCTKHRETGLASSFKRT